MSDGTSTTGAAQPARGSAAGRVLLCVVDETEEVSVAIKFAALRSKRTGAHVGLLYVTEPAKDYQHWAAIGDLMREEARAEAEQRLARAADVVQRWSGMPAIFFVREGERADEVIAQITDDPAISFVVLAAATGREGPGPLVTSLTGKLVGRLHIPLVIVPGNMSEDELAQFA